MRHWMRSWIRIVTMNTVTASADNPIRMVQTRRRRSSVMVRIMSGHLAAREAVLNLLSWPCRFISSLLNAIPRTASAAAGPGEAGSWQGQNEFNLEKLLEQLW